MEQWSKYAKVYDPIKCASIDGTDSIPHDRAVVRAVNATYKPNRFVKGRPECTIFLSRLNHETTKETIKETFSKYGKLKRFRIIKDIVTGMSKGYAFVEYEEEQSAEEAYRLANRTNIDGKNIFVDFECERLLKGWKPRRLGGGFGGKKESGQLRFGGRERPFKKPIALELKEKKEAEERRRRDRRDKRNSPSRSKRRDSRERKRPLSPKENGSSKHSQSFLEDKNIESSARDRKKSPQSRKFPARDNKRRPPRDNERRHLNGRHFSPSPQRKRTHSPRRFEDKRSRPPSPRHDRGRRSSPIRERSKRESPLRKRSPMMISKQPRRSPQNSPDRLPSKTRPTSPTRTTNGNQNWNDNSGYIPPLNMDFQYPPPSYGPSRDYTSTYQSDAPREQHFSRGQVYHLGHFPSEEQFRKDIPSLVRGRGRGGFLLPQRAGFRRY